MRIYLKKSLGEGGYRTNQREKLRAFAPQILAFMQLRHSLADIAERLGVSRQALSKFIDGEGSPEMKVLKAENGAILNGMRRFKEAFDERAADILAAAEFEAKAAASGTFQKWSARKTRA